MKWALRIDPMNGCEMDKRWFLNWLPYSLNESRQEKLLIVGDNHSLCFPIFHGKWKKISPKKGVKVGNSEIFLMATHVSRFWIYHFWINLLAFKFITYIINIKMMLCQEFHGQISNFQPSEGCQSWQLWKFLPCECKNTILNGIPLYTKVSFIYKLLDPDEIRRTLGGLCALKNEQNFELPWNHNKVYFIIITNMYMWLKIIQRVWCFLHTMYYLVLPTFVKITVCIQWYI